MATGDILNEIEAHAESAKLLRVRQLITALLLEHDVCADIILCGRGRLQVFTHLEASWSCIRVLSEGSECVLEVKTSHMPVEKQMLNTLATVGMAHSFMQLHADALDEWHGVSEHLDEEVGAVHQDLSHVVDLGPMQ